MHILQPISSAIIFIYNQAKTEGNKAMFKTKRGSTTAVVAFLRDKMYGNDFIYYTISDSFEIL